MKRQTILHKRALFYLQYIERKQKLISDLKLKIEIEQDKPCIERFLFTPKSWYDKEILKAKEVYDFLKKRYSLIIEELLK